MNKTLLLDPTTTLYRSVALACFGAWFALFAFTWRRPHNWTPWHFAALSLLCVVAALCALLAHRRTRALAPVYRRQNIAP